MTMPSSIIIKWIDASASQRVGTRPRTVLGNGIGTRSTTASKLLQERCIQECGMAGARPYEELLLDVLGRIPRGAQGQGCTSKGTGYVS